MTDEEAKKMLKAKLECLKNETSGINHDCNMRLCDGCSLNYEQGNMGEQKEALKTAIKVLEQTSWIPVKWHEITDEERVIEEYPNEWLVLFDCQMPDDGERILVQTKWGDIELDECYIDDGVSLDSGRDWIEDIVAWMPLPQPYKAESEVYADE